MIDNASFNEKVNAIVREPDVKIYMNNELMKEWELTSVIRDSRNFNGNAIGNATPQILTVSVRGKLPDLKDKELDLEYLLSGVSSDFVYPTYIVTEQKYDDAINVTTLTAKDRLNQLITEKYNAKIDESITAQAFFDGFCSHFGFAGQLDSSLKDLTMPLIPNFADEDSALTVLAKFAEFMCGNVFIKDRNVICIKELTATETVSAGVITHGLYSFTVSGGAKPVGRVVLSRGDLNDNKFYPEELSDDGSEYAIVNNPFIDNNDSSDSRENFRKIMYDHLSGKVFQSYSIEYRGNPALQCGDVIAVQGYDGNNINLYYYGEELRFENGTKASLRVEYVESNSITYNQSTTKDRFKRAEIKVDKVEAEIKMSLSELNGEVGTVQSALSNTNKTAEELAQQLKGIEGKYATLTGTLDGFRADITKIEEDLTKNPAALKNTVVEIDIKGITVGEYGQEVETNINASGLTINNVGGGQVAKFTKEGAVISSIATQTLNAAGTLFKLVNINGTLWAAAYWIGEDDLWD